MGSRFFFKYLTPFINKKKPSPYLKNNFEQKIKENVFENILKIWNSTVRYSPKKFISKKHAIKTFLKDSLHSNEVTYTGEDHFQGTLKDGRTFQFSKIIIREWVQQQTSSKQIIKGERTTFKGSILILENSLPFKEFNGRLSIFPTDHLVQKDLKKEESLSVKLLKAQQYKDNILDANFVTTPSPPSLKEAFTAQYKFHGQANDQEKLPTAIYQLVTFKEFLNVPITLQFVGSHTYILLEHTFDFFKISTDRSFLNNTFLETLSQEFHAILSLIEKVAEITQKKHTNKINTNLGE